MIKYAVYGINRIAKDFLYIFENTEIYCYIDEAHNHFFFAGKKVYSLSETLSHRAEYDSILICEKDSTSIIEMLTKNGLKREIDFITVDDLIMGLDDFKLPSNRSIAVWGTGRIAKEIIDNHDDVKPNIFIDAYKQLDSYGGVKVYHPSEVELTNYYIIVAVKNNKEIIRFLKELGLSKKDYCLYNDIMLRPSAMLRKTVFDITYCNIQCHTMLNHLEILGGGETRCCCTTFVSQELDNVVGKTKDEVWKSLIHKIMSLSCENRTYSFCDKNMCPLFVDKSKIGEWNESIQDWEYKKMCEYPETIAIAYDSSCNLACETCRKEVYFAKDEDKHNVEIIDNIFKNEYLENCKFLILAGDGEVFASPIYQSVYQDERCNPDFIRLLTNGTLFTPSNWTKIKKNKKAKFMMTVSIDAATEETYRQIRCNGDFRKLQENMRFAAELRKKGELSYLRFNFVVQKRNYQEMVVFTKWAEELGVDEVFFTKILNWGTYSNEEFKEVSMMEEDAITPKKELLDVLNNPIIKESKIVDLGTIQYNHIKDDIGEVENYYMWELEKRGGKLFS